MWFNVTHAASAHPATEVQADDATSARAYYAGLFGTRERFLIAVPIPDPFAVPVDPASLIDCEGCQ